MVDKCWGNHGSHLPRILVGQAVIPWLVASWFEHTDIKSKKKDQIEMGLGGTFGNTWSLDILNLQGTYRTQLPFVEWGICLSSCF